MNNYSCTIFYKKFIKNFSSIKKIYIKKFSKSFLMTLYFFAFKLFISLVNSKIILSH